MFELIETTHLEELTEYIVTIEKEIMEHYSNSPSGVAKTSKTVTDFQQYDQVLEKQQKIIPELFDQLLKFLASEPPLSKYTKGQLLVTLTKAEQQNVISLANLELLNTESSIRTIVENLLVKMPPGQERLNIKLLFVKILYHLRIVSRNIESRNAELINSDLQLSMPPLNKPEIFPSRPTPADALDKTNQNGIVSQPQQTTNLRQLADALLADINGNVAGQQLNVIVGRIEKAIAAISNSDRNTLEGRADILTNFTDLKLLYQEFMNLFESLNQSSSNDIAVFKKFLKFQDTLTDVLKKLQSCIVKNEQYVLSCLKTELNAVDAKLSVIAEDILNNQNKDSSVFVNHMSTLVDLDKRLATELQLNEPISYLSKTISYLSKPKDEVLVQRRVIIQIIQRQMATISQITKLHLAEQNLEIVKSQIVIKSNLPRLIARLKLIDNKVTTLTCQSELIDRELQYILDQYALQVSCTEQVLAVLKQETSVNDGNLSLWQVDKIESAIKDMKLLNFSDTKKLLSEIKNKFQLKLDQAEDASEKISQQIEKINKVLLEEDKLESLENQIKNIIVHDLLVDKQKKDAYGRALEQKLLQSTGITGMSQSLGSSLQTSLITSLGVLVMNRNSTIESLEPRLRKISEEAILEELEEQLQAKQNEIEKLENDFRDKNTKDLDLFVKIRDDLKKAIVKNLCYKDEISDEKLAKKQKQLDHQRKDLSQRREKLYQEISDYIVADSQLNTATTKLVSIENALPILGTISSNDTKLLEDLEKQIDELNITNVEYVAEYNPVLKQDLQQRRADLVLRQQNVLDHIDQGFDGIHIKEELKTVADQLTAYEETLAALNRVAPDDDLSNLKNLETQVSELAIPTCEDTVITNGPLKQHLEEQTALLLARKQAILQQIQQKFDVFDNFTEYKQALAHKEQNCKDIRDLLTENREIKDLGLLLEDLKELPPNWENADCLTIDDDGYSERQSALEIECHDLLLLIIHKLNEKIEQKTKYPNGQLKNLSLAEVDEIRGTVTKFAVPSPAKIQIISNRFRREADKSKDDEQPTKLLENECAKLFDQINNLEVDGGKKQAFIARLEKRHHKGLALDNQGNLVRVNNHLKTTYWRQAVVDNRQEAIVNMKGFCKVNPTFTFRQAIEVWKIENRQLYERSFNAHRSVISTVLSFFFRPTSHGIFMKALSTEKGKIDMKTMANLRQQSKKAAQ